MIKSSYRNCFSQTALERGTLEFLSAPCSSNISLWSWKSSYIRLNENKERNNKMVTSLRFSASIQWWFMFIEKILVWCGLFKIAPLTHIAQCPVAPLTRVCQMQATGKLEAVLAKSASSGPPHSVHMVLSILLFWMRFCHIFVCISAGAGKNYVSRPLPIKYP